MGSDTEELTKSPLVSVIIPAFNEQENIVPCTMAVRSALRKAGLDFEMLIVNDGSTDRTLEVAQAMQSKYPTVRVIDLVQNYGKTVALREGVKRAKGDLVAFFDADLQYGPDDLVRLIKRANGSPNVISGKRDYGQYGATRTSFSKLYNSILKTLLRVPISDSNCGLKVISRSMAESDTIFRYGLPLIVPLLRIRGYEIEEVPVSLHDRKAGTSKYYSDGVFLGGWKNIRDITYHSMMLLGLLMTMPFERNKNRSNT